MKMRSGLKEAVKMQWFHKGEDSKWLEEHCEDVKWFGEVYGIGSGLKMVVRNTTWFEEAYKAANWLDECQVF
jgi:hypothetical protein